MNPLSDIVVLDFCEWLKFKIDTKEMQLATPLDMFIVNKNTNGFLQKYAREFLDERKTNCCLKTTIQQFLLSKEFNCIIQRCEKRCCLLKKQGYYDVYDCIHHCEIRHAFYCFANKYQGGKYQKEPYDISADDLADYMNNIIYSDNKIKESPQFLQLMLSSEANIAEEMNFFDWLQSYIENPTDVTKMPADIFERYVDKYINSCKKGDVEKKHLLKSYRQTGWENLLETFQVIFRINRTRRSKKFEDIAERYFSKQPPFKCVLLPLSDKESQKQYCSLIEDSWNDLNDLSGDYLDIYYSESDTGKSGYDIAKRIDSLPASLKTKVPCLIIWEDSINNARYISLDELSSKQIVVVISSIVDCIIKGENIQNIVKEVNEKVKEMKEINHGVSNYYGHVITGDGNVVGDNNAVGTGNVVGDANNISGNTITTKSDEAYVKKLINEFDQAIMAIKNSSELDDNLKVQMCGIVEDAKNGTLEKSVEKQNNAKTTFGHVKIFLAKVAPNLISTLSDLAMIATFFGLTA